MERYLVMITGDMNDADYNTKLILIDEPERWRLDKLVNDLKSARQWVSAIKNQGRHVYMSDYEFTDEFWENCEEMELFLPLGDFEYSWHTVYDITIYEITGWREKIF